MVQVLHTRATTTHAIRKEIQKSDASIAELCRRYGLNPKTVRKWRSRHSVNDAPMGPKQPVSTLLTALEESAALRFRRRTSLPLDHCLIGLKLIIPHLTRASLHRLFQRHGISRLTKKIGKEPIQKRFKFQPLGCLQIDLSEIHSKDGIAYLLVAVDHASKVVNAQICGEASQANAENFMRQTLEQLPYPVHTMLIESCVG